MEKNYFFFFSRDTPCQYLSTVCQKRHIYITIITFLLLAFSTTTITAFLGDQY